MKLQFISEAEYERRLGAAINLFRASVLKHKPHGFAGKLWRTFLAEATPMSVTDVMRAMGETPDLGGIRNMFFVGRIADLVRNGWLVTDGTRIRVTQSLKRKRTYVSTANTYIAVEQAYHSDRIAAATELLNRRVDQLESLHMRASCMAVTAKGRTGAMTERERLIIKARLAGVTLEEIGKAIGVTRERARQLIVKGLMGKSERLL